MDKFCKWQCTYKDDPKMGCLAHLNEDRALYCPFSNTAQAINCADLDKIKEEETP